MSLRAAMSSRALLRLRRERGLVCGGRTRNGWVIYGSRNVGELAREMRLTPADGEQSKETGDANYAD